MQMKYSRKKTIQVLWNNIRENYSEEMRVNFFKKFFKQGKVDQFNRKAKQVNMHIVLSIVLLFFVTLVLIFFFMFYGDDKSYELTNVAMGTYVKQTVYSKDGQAICDETIKQVAKLENCLSCRKRGSEINSLNSNAGGIGWVDVNDTTLSILLSCKDVYEKSEGAYDPTMFELYSFWGFDTKSPRVPSDGEIKSALKKVNGDVLKINADVNRAKIFERGVGVDLRGVQRGAACQLAIKVYQRLKANAAIISIGDVVGVYGTKKDGKPWNIALRDQLSSEDKNKSFAAIKMKEGFVSSVGINNDSFTKNEKTYVGVLDPHTGYPVDGDMVSVSVWHKDGVLANALANACFVMGKDKAISLLEKYNAQAIFVYKDKTCFVTSNMDENFVLTDSSYKKVS